MRYGVFTPGSQVSRLMTSGGATFQKPEKRKSPRGTALAGCQVALRQGIGHYGRVGVAADGHGRPRLEVFGDYLALLTLTE